MFEGFVIPEINAAMLLIQSRKRYKSYKLTCYIYMYLELHEVNLYWNMTCCPFRLLFIAGANWSFIEIGAIPYFASLLQWLLHVTQCFCYDCSLLPELDVNEKLILIY